MSTRIGKLTVFFEEPFGVGVFEQIEDGKLSVSKVTFGAEPKDCEIYEYVLKYYNSLHFSPAIETVVKEEVKNPKKRQKEIHKQMSAKGIGTKSQQDLNLQREQYKKQRKIKSREEKLAEEKRLFFNFQCFKSSFDWNYGIECCDCGGSSNVPGLEDGKRKYH